MITISRKIKDKVPVAKVFDGVDILKYYTKTSRRVKKGLIVASVNYEKRKVSIGWSLCNTSHGDSFDKLRGIQIAIGRMEDNTFKLSDLNIDEFLFKSVPQSLHDDMLKVIERCKRMLKSSKKKNKD